VGGKRPLSRALSVRRRNETEQNCSPYRTQRFILACGPLGVRLAWRGFFWEPVGIGYFRWDGHSACDAYEKKCATITRRRTCLFC